MNGLRWAKMLEEAKQKGKDYAFSCARNVKVKFGNEDKQELDVVFLPMGKEPIVVECKSGEFRRDIEKLCTLEKTIEFAG